MAKYRLLTQHFSEEDKLLEPGTVVGTGTIHKWTRPPTAEMQGLDRESRAAVAEEKKRAGEGIDPIDRLPLTMDPSFAQAPVEPPPEEEIGEEEEGSALEEEGEEEAPDVPVPSPSGALHR